MVRPENVAAREDDEECIEKVYYDLPVGKMVHAGYTWIYVS